MKLLLKIFVLSLAATLLSSVAGAGNDNVARTAEMVDFCNAAKSNSQVKMTRNAFRYGVKTVQVNGKNARFLPKGHTVCITPEVGWEKGLNTVKIDALGRKYTLYVSHHEDIPAKVVYKQNVSTINGKPFLPLGIYAVNIKDIDKAAGYGFNLIQSYQMQKKTFPTQQYMNTAAKNKIYTFLQFDKKDVLDFNYQAVMRKAVKYMNHPALFGWYLFDEPSAKKISPAQLKFFNDMLHKLDPYHPVLTSNWEQGKFKEAIDVDMYQFYQGSPARMNRIMNKYPHRVKNEWKTFSWVAILNTHDSSFGQKGAPNNSPCTFYSSVGSDKKRIYKKGSAGYKKAEEKARKVAANLKNPPFPYSACFPQTETIMRGQAFDAIAHGSNGLFWWLWSAENKIHLRWGWYTVFHQPKLRSALRKLLKDLHKLSPYIINSAKGADTWYAGKVFFWKKNFKDNIVLIAVNESEQTVRTSVKIGKVSSKMYVFGEKRTLNTASGVLNDSFKPNEAKVYLAKMLD